MNIVALWASCFQNLFNMEVGSESEHLLQNITQDHDCNDLDRLISNTEIISSIKSIHSNRSPGPDGICIEMFKSMQNEILPFLNILFNQIYNSGVLPEDWCKNIICPIHKSGQQTNPENY